MSGDNLSDAKNEIMKQIYSYVTPCVYQGIQSIHREAQKLARNTDEERHFQLLLKQIPQWNSNIIENETKRIQGACECLPDLVTAVFVINTKILSCVSITDNTEIDFDLEVPTLDKFVFNCYMEVARCLCENPKYFLRRSTMECYQFIDNSIASAIRKMLPINKILSTYLRESKHNMATMQDEDEDEDEEEDEEKEVVTSGRELPGVAMEETVVEQEEEEDPPEEEEDPPEEEEDPPEAEEDPPEEGECPQNQQQQPAAENDECLFDDAVSSDDDS